MSNRKSISAPTTHPTPPDCYMFRMDALQRGNVILTTRPDDQISRFIGTVTDSNYSHALMVLKPPYAVESAKYGVVKFRLDRFAVRSPDNVTVLRWSGNPGDHLKLDRAVRFAERQRGRPYAHREVLVSLLRGLPPIDKGATFCSQLVAAAFLKAGIPVVPDAAPERTTPGMIANSASFTPVDNVLAKVQGDQLHFWPDFLDGEAQQSFAESESQMRQLIVKDVKADFYAKGFEINTFDEALAALLSSHREGNSHTSELDQLLAAAMDKRGFSTLPSATVPADAPILFHDFFVHHAITTGQLTMDKQEFLHEQYTAELERMNDTNQVRDGDVTAYKKAYLSTGLESLRLALAGFWDAYLISRRMQLAYERCQELLSISISSRANAP